MSKMVNKREISFLDGKTAVITGGGGVLGRSMTRALSAAGARTAVIGRTGESLRETAAAVQIDGGECLPVIADVLDESACREAGERILEGFGRIDILVNAAGGASPAASTGMEQIPAGFSPSGFGNASPTTILDIPLEAFRAAGDLNFLGTFIPTRAFLPAMVEQGAGCIVNIASMGAEWPLTKSPAYSAGKAAVVNFTRWLATHTAKAGIRVNAISPGFFLTAQNRFLLLDEATGDISARGRKIIDGTPMGRFGEPEELDGALLWLVSDSAGFVTGAVIPVDGGFGAYGGV